MTECGLSATLETERVTETQDYGSVPAVIIVCRENAANVIIAATVKIIIVVVVVIVVVVDIVVVIDTVVIVVA